jgi:hypothetical protein
LTNEYPKELLKPVIEILNNKSNYESLEYILNFYMSRIDFSVSSISTVNDLETHLNHLLEAHTAPFLQYMLDNQIIKRIEGANQRTLDKINDLKIRYGLHIQRISELNKNPFTLQSVEFNIEQKSLYHRMSLRRRDSESFTTLLTADAFLGLIGLAANSAHQALEKGVYDISTNQIEYLQNETVRLNKLLNELKSSAGKQS